MTPARSATVRDPWLEWNRACAAAHRAFSDATAEARRTFEVEWAAVSARRGSGYRAELVVLTAELDEACAPLVAIRDAALAEADRRRRRALRGAE